MTDSTPSSPPLVPVRDVSMSLVEANIIGGAFGLLAALACIIPHWLLWGGASLGTGLQVVFNPIIFVPAFIVSILVHEGLHALGWGLFGRVPWSAMHFGVKDLTPFAHCREPLRATPYRIGAFFPGLILGVVPAGLGVATGSGVLTVWGSLMLALAGGDLAILWALRRVPGQALVRDHPTRAGCEVVAEGYDSTDGYT